jgi:hypothetical protein
MELDVVIEDRRMCDKFPKGDKNIPGSLRMRSSIPFLIPLLPLS